MKTSKLFFILIAVSSLLWAQTDSTSVEAVSAEQMDSTATKLVNEIEASMNDTADVEPLTQDSVSVDSIFAAEDEMSMEEEPEMMLVPKTPESVTIAGLIAEGPVYFWSNEMVSDLGFEEMDYVQVLDPFDIAFKANDCLDIVCHLLATDSTGLNYVFLSSRDSSTFDIYNTETKVVILQAQADSIAQKFDLYLRSMAGEELLPMVQADTLSTEALPTPALVTVEPPTSGREKFQAIKRIHFRSLEAFTRNPANAARDFNSFTSWNILPDFNLSVRNSLLTPGWYSDWWTQGIDLDEGNNKEEFLSTLEGKDVTLNVNPEFKTLFGFRVGRLGVNIAMLSHIRVTLPGDLVAQPWQDIELNSPLDNSGLDLEIVPAVVKSTVGYAHPLYTPFGDLKVGVGINVFEALGYVRMRSDDLTIVTTQDSIFVTASGEGWATVAGVDGNLDGLDSDDFEAGKALSTPTVGIDLGAIMDLQPFLKQEVEVQVSLRNLGAKYTWSDVTHERWTFEQRMPAAGSADTDSIEQYQTTETITVGEAVEYSVDLPMVFSLSGIYQPLPKVIVGVGIEKAFTDENRLGYSPDVGLNYQLNLYPVSFWDISYYHRNKYGDPVHTFGTGFHFGFLETGFTVSLYNGLNKSAKGAGFGFRSSLHF